MTRPSLDQMYSEMASLARELHWSVDDVLDLSHVDRRRWLACAVDR
ncbi:hypothetical protein DSM104299_02203 [Baekduia alba]|nr:DUF6760 family protein [Baekduia alba]WCB93490.1 hypothetical protein DSM104299_02203 [Baekduia alba]